MSGLKYDGEKPDVALVPAEAILGAAKGLTYGKVKYGADNKIGQKFGKLTCESFSHKHENKPIFYYNFKCDCGKIFIKDFTELKRAFKKRNYNCPCSNTLKVENKWNNKIGETNGSVVLIKFLGLFNSIARFKYSCSCGNVKETSYTNFKNIKSCGCLGKNNNIKIGNVLKNYKILEIKDTKSKVECIECGTIRWAKNDTISRKNNSKCLCRTGYVIKEKADPLYKKYRIWRNAIKSKGRETDIDFDGFVNLIKSDCFYCGKSSNKESLNGIDRIDSKKDYLVKNTVGCCTTCNIMKNSLSVRDFINHIVKIFNHRCL